MTVTRPPARSTGAAVHFLSWERGRAQRARRGIAAASGSIILGYGLADLEDLDASASSPATSAPRMTGSTCSSVILAPSTPGSARTQPGPS